MSRRAGDPNGKRALFGKPVDVAPDLLEAGRVAEGRQALYSTGPARPGTVIVDCSSCEVRSRVSLVDIGLRIMQLSVWLPGRRHSRFMRCPSCNRRTWCRILWQH